MILLVRDLCLSPLEDQSACFGMAMRASGVPADRVRRAFIHKRSVDARRRSAIKMIYTVGLEVEEGEAYHASPAVSVLAEEPLAVVPGRETLSARPVVIGFGPAGMFCALMLARHGYRPLVLERGEAMQRREAATEAFFAGGPLDPTANVQFGEGGAGTFSDGKLTTRIGDPLCSQVLRTFVEFGASQEILYDAKPHIGTDVLRRVVVALRSAVIEAGGEVRFLTQVTDLDLAGGALRAVTAGGDTIPAQAAALCIGHSARDTFERLREKELAMEAKPFSVGARIEHRQKDIDDALFGALSGNPLLSPGSYQYSLRGPDGRAVYTFCMCPGGVVVPAASVAGGVVTNGMSNAVRSGRNANAALAVSVGPQDFGMGALDGVAFQRKIERAAYAASGGYAAPVQTVGRFLAGKAGADFGRVVPSYSIGVKPCDFTDIFPPFVLAKLREGIGDFGRRLRGFDAPDAVLTAPETRTSSPVRILRGEDGQSPTTSGLYPCGEGCGYAGGIMSAAVDGLRCALRIINRYKPFE